MINALKDTGTCEAWGVKRCGTGPLILPAVVTATTQLNTQSSNTDGSLLTSKNESRASPNDTTNIDQPVAVDVTVGQ